MKSIEAIREFLGDCCASCARTLPGWLVARTSACAQIAKDALPLVSTEVITPEVGIPFTDITAWHHVAKLVEDGHELTETVLEHPSGEKAYVIPFSLRRTCRTST